MNRSFDNAILMTFGVALGAVLCGVVLVVNEDTAEKAKRICEETGGEMLVTEFNSKTGLTMNCFYPGTFEQPDVTEL